MSYNIKTLRKIARSHKWQLLYRRVKDTHGFSLYNNSNDLGNLQLLFLQWLEVYNMLNMDIAMKRPFISKEILDDDLRTEAYLLIREEIIEKENDVSPNKKQKKTAPVGHSVIFRKG